MSEFNKMSDEEFRKRSESLAQKNAEIAEQRGYIRGQLDSDKERLCKDPQLREALRAKEWVKAGAKVTAEDGKFVGLPDGWPDHVEDPAAFVEETIGARMQPLYDRLEAPGRSTGEHATPGEPSAFARSLRRKLGVK